MTRKTTEGRHRVADGPAAEPPLEAVTDPLHLPVLADASGPFTVQLLGDRWFIGEPGVAQRIEDLPWLDGWLAANGASGRQDLDFSGDRELEQRFHAELGAVARPSATPPRQREGSGAE